MTEDDAYVAGLPEAHGTFTGDFNPDILPALLEPEPGLMAIEVNSGDLPNPFVMATATFVINAGGQRWELPVDHVEMLTAHRARIWVRRPGRQS